MIEPDDVVDEHDAKLTATLATLGLTFEAAEALALDTVREYVAKYGDTAPTVLAFSSYKASRRDPDSRNAIVFKLAQVILSEAR